MKRNFLTLALAGAFGLALLGSASAALAAGICPPGTTNGGLLAGNYAIKIAGAVTETSITNGDPEPIPEAGIGVIQVDGLCDITAGELIFNKNDTVAGWSSPTTINVAGAPFVPAFSGTMVGYPAGDYGAYYFNTNHSGTITLIDAPSGLSFTFGVTAEAGGLEFRGARIDPGDPLVILGEKQNVTALGTNGVNTFLTTTGVSFDAGSGGVVGGALGVGFDAVQTEVAEHYDPETGTVVEGGGSIFFNVDNGYDSTFANGFQIIPPGGGALVCDFHETIIGAGPSVTDGTQVTDAALNGDFGCPLGGNGFENASVVWGTVNQSAFILTTGSGGIASGGPSTGSASKAIATGIGKILPTSGVLTTTNLNPNPSVTLTVTNGSVEPIDYTGISLSGTVPDVTITGGTCLTTGGAIPANNPLIGVAFPLGTNTCTITLTDSGAMCTPLGNAACTKTAKPYACCTGLGTGTCAGKETGTLLIAGNDHVISPPLDQTSLGMVLPVICQ